MFDIAPSELLLVAIVALVVIGPKDLPRAMRVVGQWVGRARGMARHFRSGFDEMVRQAEIEEMEKRWAAENARIMAAHPMPPPEEAEDAAAAAGPGTGDSHGTATIAEAADGATPPTAPTLGTTAAGELAAAPAPRPAEDQK